MVLKYKTCKRLKRTMGSNFQHNPENSALISGWFKCFHHSKSFSTRDLHNIEVWNYSIWSVKFLATSLHFGEPARSEWYRSEWWVPRGEWLTRNSRTAMQNVKSNLTSLIFTLVFILFCHCNLEYLLGPQTWLNHTAHAYFSSNSFLIDVNTWRNSTLQANFLRHLTDWSHEWKNQRCPDR